MNEKFSQKSNRLLKFQQANKHDMPPPMSPNFLKNDRINRSRRERNVKINKTHDSNRKLTTFGFTSTSRTSESNNTSTQPISTDDVSNKSSNKVGDSAKQLSDQIVASLDEMVAEKENFANEIQAITGMAKEKEKISTAFDKLCDLVLRNNSKMMTLHYTTQQHLLSILALQRDQEVENQRRDMSITSNSNRIQSLETKNCCQKDLQKIWITFTCEKEITELQKSRNLIAETRKIFERMNIDLNELGIMPIKSVHFQHIRIGKSYVLTLCVTFMTEKIAAFVRQRMIQFNSLLEDSGKLNEMRYSERIFWSKDVWKLLKICWELKRVNLISAVRVHTEGINATFVEKSGNEEKKAVINITSFADIDTLRIRVSDIYHDVACEQVYHDQYFMMSYAERDRRRAEVPSGNTEENEDENSDFQEAQSMETN